MRSAVHKDLRTPKYKVRVVKNTRRERDKYRCRHVRWEKIRKELER